MDRLHRLEGFLVEHVVLELGTIRRALAEAAECFPASMAPGPAETEVILARLAALEAEARSLCAVRRPLSATAASVAPPKGSGRKGSARQDPGTGPEVPKEERERGQLAAIQAALSAQRARAAAPPAPAARQSGGAPASGRSAVAPRSVAPADGSAPAGPVPQASRPAADEDTARLLALVAELGREVERLDSDTATGAKPMAAPPAAVPSPGADRLILRNALPC